MTKFYRPPVSFNPTIAEDGVWFKTFDKTGEYLYGRFRCRLMEPTIPRHRILLDRLERKNNAANKNRTMSVKEEQKRGYEQMVTLFVESSLIDWDMKDENGKAIPFSRSAAMEYFLENEIIEGSSDPHYIYGSCFSELLSEATTVTNFRADEQNLAGDPVKN